jgi:AcrR family transcriptional regulator
MSIYNHVPGKAALLDAVSEAVLAEAAGDLEHLPDEWFDVARAIAHSYREMAMRHPHVFPLLATRSQRSAVALQALEKLSAAMRRAGIADQVVADAPMVLFGFLNGCLLAVVGADAGSATLEERVVAAAAAVDPVSFPAMSVLAELQVDYGTRDHFDRMLDIVLAGLRAQRSGPKPS